MMIKVVVVKVCMMVQRIRHGHRLMMMIMIMIMIMMIVVLFKVRCNSCVWIRISSSSRSSCSVIWIIHDYSSIHV